jgi:hypothetical protein
VKLVTSDKSFNSAVIHHGLLTQFLRLGETVTWEKRREEKRREASDVVIHPLREGQFREVQTHKESLQHEDNFQNCTHP